MLKKLSFGALILLCCSGVAVAGGPVSAGVNHSIALQSDGTVWAWGYNHRGQLGDGTFAERTTPVQVSGLTGITAVDAGYYHSLALKNDGTAWAWGWNFYGQLGDGTTADRTTPVQVSGLTGITAVDAGWYHGLAVKNDGTAWAWGYGSNGELGNGTTTDSTIPVQVSGLTGITAVTAGGSHSMALKNDGTVWAWGSNSAGQLGNGTTTSSTTPVQVSGLTGITAVDAGGIHSMALKNDGTVWAWGSNSAGQLGNGTTTASTTPVQVSGLTGITAVDTGWYHGLAVKNDGTAWAWGRNIDGQLGNGTTTSSTTPVQVSGLTGITAVAAGYYHSLALENDGTVWAWGSNYAGQLGNGTYIVSTTPVQVSGTGPPASAPDITVTDSVAPTNDNQVLFGSVTTGTTSDQTVTVQNDGNANLALGSIAGANPLAAPFSVQNDTCSGRTLEPAGSCTLTVRFAPSATGAAGDTFDIPSDDPDENPVTVAVGGTGIAASAPDITATDSLGNGSDLQMPFPDTTEGVTSSAETVTLRNVGNAVLNVSAIQISGANSAEFTLDVNGGSNPCGSTSPSVAAGDNCTVTVAFAPASTGDKTATLAISSDDPDEGTVNVALTGTGLSASVNNPPGKPTLVSPANGQAGLSSTVTFTWKPVTDPDGDPVTYDLYYCTDDDPIANCTPIQVAATRTPGNRTLYAGLTSGAGFLLIGFLLEFPSLRRKILSLAAGILLVGSLAASCGNHHGEDYVTYTATGLAPGTTCHWAVVAKDDKAAPTASDTWSFTTQ